MATSVKRKAIEMEAKVADDVQCEAVPNEPQLKRQKLNATENDTQDADEEKKSDQNETERQTKKKRKTNAGTKPPSKGNRVDKLPSYYFFVNGYRYIAPYHFEYRCFAKGRWFDREIFEVMTTEFVAYDAVYYKQAILSGKILVRDHKVPLNYLIKNGDWITHQIHRHEPPILCSSNTPQKHSIEVIEENEDILVICKPSGMPIHPCGKYRFNTLIYILYNEHGRKDVYSAHRLDRVTSGLMLLCKTKRMAQTLGAKIRDRDMKKTYLARVQGRFPVPSAESKDDDNDSGNSRITVNQPIRCKDHQKGVHEIHEDGKDAMTEFEFISYDAQSDTSLVYCYPKTGRTHQIRLHLQYLKHPIVNDFAYGGKDSNEKHWIPTDEHEKQKLVDEIKKHWDEECVECKLILDEMNGTCTGQVRNSAPEIWLHALKYECDDFSYSVPKPYWA